MSVSERKPVIITFRTKATPDIVADSCKTAKVPFIHANTLTVKDLTPDIEPESIGLVMEEVKSVSASLPDTVIKKLKENPAVEMVEEDTEMYALEEAYRMPFPMQGIEPQSTPLPFWPFCRCGYTDRLPWGVNRIDAERAWEVTQGKGIKVAVADTGIDYKHPDLRANYRGGVSFVPGEPDPIDHNRHGTHVAGTIAATRNCLGVVGVAPSAYLHSVKVLNSRGRGLFSYLIGGLEWCIRHKIDIINMSLGALSAPTAVKRMCDIAYSKGILLVAAAGNSGGAVGYPAKYPSVIAVSATDSNDNLAHFSSRGPEVELCAPGVNITSTLPGGRYGNLSGTSMASPHVAGAAALALSSHRYIHRVGRTSTIVRRLLAWTADDLGPPGRDPNFGFGMVDAEQAAFERRVPPSLPGIP